MLVFCILAHALLLKRLLIVKGDHAGALVAWRLTQRRRIKGQGPLLEPNPVHGILGTWIA